MRWWAIAALALTTCLSSGAAPDAFLEGSPFHAFVQEHVVDLDPDADPALDNYVHVEEQGYDALVLRVHLLRTAKHTVDIQTFIWGTDECAILFGYEVRQALERGVRVRILADQIGSVSDPVNLAYVATQYPNLDIKYYRPLGGRAQASKPRALLDAIRFTGTNQRLHIKTVIVDGVVGITGGRNIDNKYYGYALGYNFKDRDALVVGPAIKGMVDSFEDYWAAKESVASTDLKDVQQHIEAGATADPRTHDEVYFNDFFHRLDRESNDEAVIREKFIDTLMAADRVTYVADDPGKKKKNFYFSTGETGRMTGEIVDHIINAKHTVLIQSPYVVLNRRSSRGFRRIREQNPDLRIMISTNSFGAADHLITYATNYRLRTRVVLSHEMEVFEYKPYPDDLEHYLWYHETLDEMAEEEGLARKPYMSIHAKSIVFDDDIGYIGTWNFDPRAWYHNSEGGVFIEDKEIVALLKADILRDMSPQNSYTIGRKRRKLFWPNRAVEWVSMQLPIDFWPYRSTTGYELKAGHEPMSSEDPEFYNHYEDVGKFPGVEGPAKSKFTVRLLKMFSKPATPYL
jgi:phosphatidylserine/phosphatidylglycerophosphate/cardiolipin synthase-like enzyme